MSHSNYRCQNLSAPNSMPMDESLSLGEITTFVFSPHFFIILVHSIPSMLNIYDARQHKTEAITMVSRTKVSKGEILSY